MTRKASPGGTGIVGAIVLGFFALALGGALAFFVARDPGYVLIAYGGATLETSVWFAVLCMVVLASVLLLLSFVARRFLRSRARIAEWARGRRALGARMRAQRGTMLLAEGRWREAARDLLASVENPGLTASPLANFFGAARAANALGDYGERDDTLRRAGEAMPEAEFVAGLTRAELQQTAKQWRESVATLNSLRRRAPDHPLLLQRLFAAHRALGDTDAALELAPHLPDDAPLAEVRNAAWSARLARAASGTDNLRDIWRAMPKSLRSAEPMLLRYVDALLAQGEFAVAETALRRGLKSDWRESWVLRYGTLPTDSKQPSIVKRLSTATGWLRNHPNDSALRLTLGRLAHAAGKRDEAKEHLEASLNLEPTPATLVELGRLHVARGEHVAASGAFERALQGDLAQRLGVGDGSNSGIDDGSRVLERTQEVAERVERK